jgi:hypothetical protein
MVSTERAEMLTTMLYSRRSHSSPDCEGCTLEEAVSPPWHEETFKDYQHFSEREVGVLGQFQLHLHKIAYQGYIAYQAPPH